MSVRHVSLSVADATEDAQCARSSLIAHRHSCCGTARRHVATLRSERAAPNLQMLFRCISSQQNQPVASSNAFLATDMLRRFRVSRFSTCISSGASSSAAGVGVGASDGKVSCAGCSLTCCSD